MGILSKFREHAAMAGGDYATLFKDVEIPQLPAAVACLISEFNKPDPDIKRLTEIISADLEVSTKVMRTVNSAYYGLPNQIKSIHNAIMVLGLRSIWTIAMTYTMKASLPKPDEALFNQEAFWTDSLLRALLARSLAGRHQPGEEDEAFTASLLSKVALPVLLCSWGDYYSPVIELWRDGTAKLSKVEQEEFGWDHAQAGAWILKSWNFPDEIVGIVGAHNFTVAQIRKHGLEKTIALPVTTASLLPSVLRPSMRDSKLLLGRACKMFSMTAGEFGRLVHDVQTKFNGICAQFGLESENMGSSLENILRLCDPQYAEKSS